MHYGFWGALMILFIYPFGKRFRELAPNAHTLAEIMHARHGTQSQLILAGSNIVGSIISLMVNFTAAGALVEILSPLALFMVFSLQELAFYPIRFGQVFVPQYLPTLVNW